MKIKGIDIKEIIKNTGDERLLELITLSIIANNKGPVVTENYIARMLPITLENLVNDKVLTKQRVKRILKGGY